MSDCCEGVSFRFDVCGPLAIKLARIPSLEMIGAELSNLFEIFMSEPLN